MSLAPVSAIAVSEIAMWFGVGLQLGIEVKFLVTSEFLSLLGLEFIKKNTECVGPMPSGGECIPALVLCFAGA